jgi:hypothetical protein
MNVVMRSVVGIRLGCGRERGKGEAWMGLEKFGALAAM